MPAISVRLRDVFTSEIRSRPTPGAASFWPLKRGKQAIETRQAYDDPSENLNALRTAIGLGLDIARSALT